MICCLYALCLLVKIPSTATKITVMPSEVVTVMIPFHVFTVGTTAWPAASSGAGHVRTDALQVPCWLNSCGTTV